MKYILSFILVFSFVGVSVNVAAQEKEKGDVRVTKAPKLKKEVKAEYTEAAVKNKIEGPVKLRLTITAGGAVEKVEVLAGLGYGLDEAAVTAAKQFEFSPAEINNQPSAVVLSFTVNFSLPILPATLKGNIVDKETGNGIEATIAIEYIGKDYDEKPSATSNTDAAGAFIFENIPPGKYKIKINVPFYEDFETEADLAGGKISELDYKIAAKAINLVGQVREAGSRKPLSAVTVNLLDSNDTPLQDTFTDEDGNFGFKGLPAGDYYVRFDADGYLANGTEVKVADGEVTEGTFYIDAEYYDEYSVETRAKKIRKEVSRRRLSLDEVRRIPGTGGDIVRVVQNLPGVARAPFVSGLIVVRGAAPQDTKIFIDGDSIPIVYHFLGGPAVINSEMIDSLEFYPGNFSTYYGRATGGVIDLSTRSPKTDRIHGMLEVDVLDATALLEGPITDDLSFAVSARRSYFDAFLPLLPLDDFSVFPFYYDYQTWITYKGIEDHTLELLIYGSSDNLELLFPDDEPAGNREVQVSGIEFGNSFIRGQAKWEWDPKLPVSNKFMTSYGLNSLGFEAAENLAFQLDFFLTQIRNDTRIKFAEEFELRLGIDNQFGIADVSFTSPGFAENETDNNGDGNGRPNSDPNGLEFESNGATQLFPAFYVEPEIRLFDKKLLLVPGIRVDHYGNLGDTSVSPRFAARWDITDEVTTKGGVGLFTQPPLNGAEDPNFGNPEVTFESAIQYAIGTEWKPLEYLEFDVTLFYRDQFDLLSQTDEFTIDDEGEVSPVVFLNEGKGRAYGAEILLRHYPNNRFFGWLAYTISKSERLNLDTGNYDPFQFDQTHILTLVAGYNLPSNWDISSRFRLVTGSPYTPVVGSAFNSDADEYQRVLGPTNSARNETFHQLDIRVDKKFVFDTWVLGFYLDVQNIYNQRNPEGRRYNYDYSESDIVPGLPILPTLGISGQF